MNPNNPRIFCIIRWKESALSFCFSHKSLGVVYTKIWKVLPSGKTTLKLLQNCFHCFQLLLSLALVPSNIYFNYNMQITASLSWTINTLYINYQITNNRNHKSFGAILHTNVFSQKTSSKKLFMALLTVSLNFDRFEFWMSRVKFLTVLHHLR